MGIDPGIWFIIIFSGIALLIYVVYKLTLVFTKSSQEAEAARYKREIDAEAVRYKREIDAEASRYKREAESAALHQFGSWKVQHLETAKEENERYRKQQEVILNAKLERWKREHTAEIQKHATDAARNELASWKVEVEKQIRKDAAARSQDTTIGKVLEQFAPVLPNFKFSPKDARFLGSPIDFVVFDGANENEVRQIVFIEVKTGSSIMSPRQKAIKQIIDQGKVSFELLRLPSACGPVPGDVPPLPATGLFDPELAPECDPPPASADVVEPGTETGIAEPSLPTESFDRTFSPKALCRRQQLGTACPHPP